MLRSDLSESALFELGLRLAKQLGRCTDLGPGAPVDGQRRQALGMAVCGEGVQEGVRGGVVRLAAVAQQPGPGREGSVFVSSWR